MSQRELPHPHYSAYNITSLDSYSHLGSHYLFITRPILGKGRTDLEFKICSTHPSLLHTSLLLSLLLFLPKGMSFLIMNGLCKSLGCLGALLKIYNYGNLVSYLNCEVNQCIRGLMLLCSCPTGFKEEQRGKIWERNF